MDDTETVFTGHPTQPRALFQRPPRARLAILGLLVVMLPLSGCATGSIRPGSATASETPTPTPSDPVSTPIASASPTSLPTPTGTPITVTIANSGADGTNIFASGLVTGEAGDGGVCALTATAEDGRMVTGRSNAHQTPEALNCGIIRLAADPGDWSLVLSFESSTSSGSSAPVVVHQP